VGRRTLLLVAAVVIAAVGAGLVFAYAHGANNRALKNQQPVKVLVAKKLIGAGTTAAAAAQAGSFESKDVPRSAVAAGALSDITPIATEVALAPIFPGEQVLAAKFGTQGSTSALPITKGKLAVSLQLADPQRVAGFVQPGSNVAVFATVTAGGASGSTGATAQQDSTRLVLPRALVIAVGPTTAVPTQGTQVSNSGVATAIITLALNQRDAEKVILAQTVGDLYLGLLTPASRVGPNGAAVTAQNLFR
jgi:pilus assembly protein CpaB